MNKHISIFVVLLLLLSVNTTVSAQTPAPTISQITDNRTAYPNSEIPRYEKLEISFTVSTTATQPQFPFIPSISPTPPAGVEPATGITVDAEFTPDNWVTVYRQPAFYYQDFEYKTIGTNSDWLYPTDTYVWKVRFAPDRVGAWKYRLTATDGGGSVTTPAIALPNQGTFTVANSLKKGFVKVSSTDSRYFEYDDGSFFPGLGYNENYRGLDWIHPVQGNLAKLQTMGQNGIQFTRIWLSQWPIYGAMWAPWRSHTGGGYFPAHRYTLDPNNVDPSHEVAIRIDGATYKCMIWGDNSYQLPLKKSTTLEPVDYEVKVRYKTDGLVPQDTTFSNAGLVAKKGGWLYSTGLWDLTTRNECFEPGAGTVISDYSPLDTQGAWRELTGVFRSGTNENFIGNFYLALENIASGSAYIDFASVREKKTDGTFGPNVISKPTMNHHMYFDQRHSYAFDKTLEQAEQNGVTIRPVLFEKNDTIFNRIDSATGQITPTSSSTNFYGSRALTRVRWLQRAYWRYVQARWGYSPAIHSWELLNEGDPFHGGHYTLTDELGKYMHCGVFGVDPPTGSNKCPTTFNHPNDHLVSTSTWHSFPVDKMWSDLEKKYPGSGLVNSYPNVDFSDVHRYLSTTDYAVRIDHYTPPDFTKFAISNVILPGSTYYDLVAATDLLSKGIGASTPFGPRKPVVRGETGFDVDDTEIQKDTAGIWVHNLAWAQINSGGMYDASYWWVNKHIYYAYDHDANPSTAKINIDHRPHFKKYFDFIKDIPLSNGKYIDIGATSTNSNIRVLGQKDTTNGNAHFWVQNAHHRWWIDIPAFVNDKAISFGKVTLGQTGTASISFRNPETKVITFTSFTIGLTNSDFKITSHTCTTVAVNGTCTINLSYTPIQKSLIDTLTFQYTYTDDSNKLITKTQKRLLLGLRPDYEESGTITIPGFQPNKQYDVQTWDTYTGTKITSTKTANASGVISFSISNLTTDTAFKIINPTGGPKVGDIDNDGDVDTNDVKQALSNYGKVNPTNSRLDIMSDGKVNALDTTLVIVNLP